MKRLILIICLILSCILFINECRHISDTEQTSNMYASKKETAYPENYVPIPKELSNQYKAEMEQIIDEEYPKVIKKIDECVIEAQIHYNNIIKYGYYSNNQIDAINLGLIYEMCIPTSSLDLYGKLIKVTKEKYLGEKYEPLGTDWVTPLENSINPYLQKNKVNTDKLNDIIQYEITHDKTIKNFVEKAEKLRHSNI
ncbi:MAG: hypothetical protein K6A44_07815 [bacterium]|nr:hypothetical protein [bacterium]